MAVAVRGPSIDLPRVSFFGSSSALSAAVLEALVSRHLPVAAVVVASPALGHRGAAAWLQPPLAGRSLALAPHQGPRTVWALAAERGLAVVSVGRSAGLRSTVVRDAAAGASLLVVACFPWRLPASLLADHALGGINVHPSLLPRGRGPNPRFWTFRRGASRGGVTVHRLTAELDAGPILAQAAFGLANGLTGPRFDALAGAIGGRLVVRAAHELAAGRAQPTEQATDRASYDPAPNAADYVLDLAQPARRVYNFARGVADDGVPLAVYVSGRRRVVREVVGWRRQRGGLGVDGVTWLDCAWGSVGVRLLEGDGADAAC